MTDQTTCKQCHQPLPKQPPDFAQGLCHGCWYKSDLSGAETQRRRDSENEHGQWEHERTHPDYIDESREA